MKTVKLFKYYPTTKFAYENNGRIIRPLGGQGVGRLLGWLPQVGSYRGGRGAGGSGTAPGWPPGG